MTQDTTVKPPGRLLTFDGTGALLVNLSAFAIAIGGAVVPPQGPYTVPPGTRSIQVDVAQDTPLRITIGSAPLAGSGQVLAPFVGDIRFDLKTGNPIPNAALKAMPEGTPYTDPRGRRWEWRLGSLKLVAPRDSLDLIDVLPERGYRAAGLAQALTTGGASTDYDSPRLHNVIVVRRTIHRLPRIVIPISNATGGGAVSADCLLSVQFGISKAIPNGGYGYRRVAPGGLFRNCRYQILGWTGQNMIDSDIIPLYPVDGSAPTHIPPGVYYLSWAYRLRGTTPPNVYTRGLLPGANGALKGDRSEPSMTYANLVWSATATPTTSSANTIPADFIFDAELRP